MSGKKKKERKECLLKFIDIVPRLLKGFKLVKPYIYPFFKAKL